MGSRLETRSGHCPGGLGLSALAWRMPHREMAMAMAMPHLQAKHGHNLLALRHFW
jgi:hypothetical protein